MAVHDLDMSRFLAGDDPVDILAIGSCHIDKSISELDGSEKFDTASCLVRYPNGVQAMVDVCRQSSYGYDQRAEVLGTQGMIQTDNVYPNTAKIYKNGRLAGRHTHNFRLSLTPKPSMCLQTLPVTPICHTISSFRVTTRHT